MYKNLITLIFLLLTGTLAGQGWERVYPGLGNDEGAAVALTHDGGYVMTGAYNYEKALLIKTNPDGYIDWAKPFNSGVSNKVLLGTSIAVLPDTNYVIAGYIDSLGIDRDGFIAKTNSDGDVLWLKEIGTLNADEEFLDFAVLPDGGFMLTGFQTNGGQDDVLLVRTDSEGNLLWLKTFGEPDQEERANAIVLASNGEIILGGQNFDAPSTYCYVLRLNQVGDLIWQNNYGLLSVPNDYASDILESQDENILIVGSTNAIQGGPSGLIMKIGGDGDNTPLWFEEYPDTIFSSIAPDRLGGFFVAGRIEYGSSFDDLCVMRMNSLGDIQWFTAAGKAGGADYANEVIATDDGGAAVIGTTAQFVGANSASAYLVKTDSDGVVFTNYIQGNVFFDTNGNCIQDAGEEEIPNWLLTLSSPTYYRNIITNGLGEFEFLLDTGSFEVKPIMPNEYWGTGICPDIIQVNIPNPYDTIEVKVPVRNLIDCPRNEVDIVTPALRVCQTNTYTVQYCNSGISPSENTRVEVIFDEALMVTGSSIAPVSVVDSLYTFNVGTILPGECKKFTIDAFLDCATNAGETHCATAHIYPDSFCIAPGWNGSIIEAKAECQGDTLVRMILRNKGVGPANQIEYVIAEDIIMLTEPGDPDFIIETLNPQQDSIVFQTPGNGKTYRILANQSDTYPGFSYPTAAVEGCGTDSAGIYSTGFYTMFPDDEQDAFVASDCQESYETDFNSIYFKRGHPKGYDVPHYISPQTDLDYLIYFRNTGSETVDQVIVRDTLSQFLDPTTVYPGASSHPYEFQVYGDGIVQFTINNANLIPDEGEGFVSFRVSQIEDEIPCNTELINTAAIYFDFNAPVVTNEVFHTICERDSFLVVNTEKIYIPTADVNISPNPFVESTQFEITGINASQYLLEVYDIQGRLLFNQYYPNPTFRLFKSQVPSSGVHIFRIVADGRPVASGKILALD